MPHILDNKLNEFGMIVLENKSLYNTNILLEEKILYNKHSNDLTLIPVNLIYDCRFIDFTIIRLRNLYKEAAVNEFKRIIVNSNFDGLSSLILYFNVLPQKGETIIVEDFLLQFRTNETNTEWDSLFNEGDFNVFLDQRIIISDEPATHCYTGDRPYISLHYHFDLIYSLTKRTK